MIGKQISPNATAVLSFDDYHPQNIKLANLLRQYDLPATFFIETLTTGAEDQIKALSALGFEIGSHTMSHPPDIKQMGSEALRSELETSKLQIERWTGKPCTVLAYPRGRFNDDVVAAAARAGYIEARTTHVLKNGAAGDLLRTPTTIHAFDGRKEYDGRPWLVMADFYLDHILKTGGVFHLWGHAFEFDRYDTWPQLEKMFARLKALPA